MKDKHIHFIGVGGVGVNALARLALDMGAKVSGSDLKLNELTDKLVASGAQIWEGVNAGRLKDVDLAVYSSAISMDNVELSYLKKAGVRVYERQRFLYDMSRKFANVIAVAGTHGKTTTTAMITHIFYNEYKNFISLIGGDSVDYGNYFNSSPKDAPDKKSLIVEACEYKRNFLFLKPTVGIALNAECDHPDCYKNIDEVYDAFGNFIRKSQIKILPSSLMHLVGKRSYEGDICVIYPDKMQTYKLCLKDGDHYIFKDGKAHLLQLSDKGEYNFYNAAFAIAACEAMGIDIDRCVDALKTFAGVKRRFEFAAKLKNTPVYFDFAHHPTEIACLLERASEFGKILTVFQPHTYSRLKAYLDDFAKVFSTLDGDIGLMDVYAARERESAGVKTEVLRDLLFDKFHKTNVYMLKSTDETYEFVKTRAQQYDIVLFVGAGDIYRMKEKFVE